MLLQCAPEPEAHDDGGTAGGFEREAPFIMADIRASAGTSSRFRVLDLSRGGCLVDREVWGIREGQRVWISFPAVSNIIATVAWIEGDRAGLAFDQILHEAVYEHLRRPLDA